MLPFAQKLKLLERYDDDDGSPLTGHYGHRRVYVYIPAYVVPTYRQGKKLPSTTV